MTEHQSHPSTHGFPPTAVPREAINAAAEALEARSENDDWEWCLGDAQTALDAALPILNSTPRQPASQVLAEAASALHSTERTDTKDWTELTEDEKVPYIARALRPTLAVLLSTQPAGWQALAAEIHAVDHALARREGKL